MPRSTPDFAGLRKVIQAIDDVPEEQFEMSLDCVWFRCAIAHFCRANPADALKLGRGGLFWLFPVPRLGRLKGDAAVYKRFGLLRDDDRLLFDPCEYGVECRQDRISRGEVVARIKHFIQKYEANLGLPGGLLSPRLKSGKNGGIGRCV